MELVLEIVLDIIFQISRDIISMSYISNPRHWYCTHELICKTRQLGFQKSDDMHVAEVAAVKNPTCIRHKIPIFKILIVDHTQLFIHELKHFIGLLCLGAWSVMALIATFDLGGVDEVQVGGEEGKTLGPKGGEGLEVVLVFVHQVLTHL